MSTTTRTDVHRPSALVTEHYDFFACGYYGTADEPGFSPLNTPEGRLLLDEGWRFDGVSGGGCDHCGAHLRYYAILQHAPSRTLIRVGETCLDNRFSLATAEFHRVRKAAQLDRERQRVKNTRLAWFAVNPDREVAFGWASAMVSEGAYGYEGMRHSFVHKVNRYGSTSDKFVAAMLRDMVRTERRDEERAAEEATRCPVVAGKAVQVEGEVVSVKWQENAYGGRLVFTVKDDRGFMVWGSVPSAIDGVERGDRVRYVADVEASDRDECFGFAKRPRKAEQL